MIGAEDERIAALANEGRSCKAIAAALELYPSQVQGRLSVLARAGLIPRKTGAATPARVPRRITPPLLDARPPLAGLDTRPAVAGEAPVSAAAQAVDRDPIRARIRAEYAKPDGMQTGDPAALLAISERRLRAIAGNMAIKRHPDWVGQRRLSSGKSRPVAPPRPRPKDELRSFERLSGLDLGPGAPAAGPWPETAPHFTDVARLALLREMAVPAFRRWPGPVTRQSITGCALAVFA